MESVIEFDRMLLGDLTGVKRVPIIDYGFWAHKISILPRYRPFLLEKIVDLAQEYCVDQLFKELLINECKDECPILLHRLHRKGIIEFNDIGSFDTMKIMKKFVLCYCFQEFIPDFDNHTIHKYHPIGFNKIANYIDECIEFGFPKSSIEFSMKYDDLEALNAYLSDPSISNQNDCSWNPFEWAENPESLDFLSFCGYFGSINCFKRLMMNGLQITQSTMENIVCSGNIDLFHIGCDFKNHGTRLLMKAAEYGWNHMIDFLVEQKVDVNQADRRLETPMHFATCGNSISIIDLLRQNGADINIQDGCLWTPLHIAAYDNIQVIVEYLVSYGAMVNIKNHTESTPLHFASFYGNANMVEVLIKNGADINAVTSSFETPLHSAVTKNDPNIIKCLLSYGADTTIKNEDMSFKFIH